MGKVDNRVKESARIQYELVKSGEFCKFVCEVEFAKRLNAKRLNEKSGFF